MRSTQGSQSASTPTRRGQLGGIACARHGRRRPRMLIKNATHTMGQPTRRRTLRSTQQSGQGSAPRLSTLCALRGSSALPTCPRRLQHATRAPTVSAARMHTAAAEACAIMARAPQAGDASRHRRRRTGHSSWHWMSTPRVPSWIHASVNAKYALDQSTGLRSLCDTHEAVVRGAAPGTGQALSHVAARLRAGGAPVVADRQ